MSKKSNQSKQKFTLCEMFLIYLFQDKTELLSHKIAITRQIQDFIEIKGFARLIDINNEIQNNIKKIAAKYKSKQNKLIQLLKPYLGKDRSTLEESVVKKEQELKALQQKINDEINSLNENLFKEFDSLTSEETEYNCNYTHLVFEVIDYFIKKNDQIEHLKKTGFGDKELQVLIDLYLKLSNGS